MDVKQEQIARPSGWRVFAGSVLLLAGCFNVIWGLVALFNPDGAFVYLFGVSLFGGLFVWLMIFITHLYFRPRWDATGRPRLLVRMIGYPYTSLLGAAFLVAILLTTWWVEGMRITLIAGIPWLAVVSLLYFAMRRKFANKQYPLD